jgi:hypothetical protein
MSFDLALMIALILKGFVEFPLAFTAGLTAFPGPSCVFKDFNSFVTSTVVHTPRFSKKTWSKETQRASASSALLATLDMSPSIKASDTPPSLSFSLLSGLVTSPVMLKASKYFLLRFLPVSK